MTQQTIKEITTTLTVTACLVVFGTLVGRAAATEPADWAAKIIKESGRAGGLIVHVGCGDHPELSIALRINDAFVVQGLETDGDKVSKARKVIEDAGIYGPVSVIEWDGKTLPYADNFASLVVAPPEMHKSRAEIERILAPGGTAVFLNPQSAIVDQKLQKPWPAAMDIWTHYLHSAANNPVSRDQLVAPPNQLRWLVEPLYYRSHSWNKSVVGMVTANGRIYQIEDRGPTGTLDTRFSERWFVVCRDAFNGIELWTVPMGPKWGWREWEETGPQPNQKVAMGPIAGLWTMPVSCNRRIITDPKRDVVFVTLEYRAPITVLDAKTGKVLKTFDQAGPVDEILQAEDGTLIVRAREIPPRKTPYGVKTNDELMKDFSPAKPDRVAALDPDTGAVRWATEVGHLSPQNLAALNGRVVCFNYRELITLDQHTGAVLWRQDLEAGGQKDQKTGVAYFPLRLGGRLALHGQQVIFAGGGGLQVFEAATGKLLWKGRPGGVGGGAFGMGSWLYVADGLLWTTDARGGRAIGMDPATGKEARTIDIGQMLQRGHHPRCYHPKATDRFLMANMRGAEFIDLRGDNHAAPDWIHGGCGLGVLPANGLLYDPPDPCACYKGTKVPGLKALAGGDLNLHNLPTPNQRLINGPAYGKAVAPRPASPADWPMYRHDAERSGRNPTPVPATVKVLWSAPLGGKGTQPVVADGQVYVAVPERHRVDCLELATGKKLWSFTAGGPVSLSPTVADGRVYLGGMDGRVYCLNAADGTLCWSYLAAPVERRINVLGRLESPWPVHGAVLVHGGKVFASAGRSSYLDGGIFFVALDAATGKLLHEARLDGPHPTLEKLKKGVDKEKYGSGYVMEGSLNDIFTLAGDRLFMFFQVFDLSLRPVAIPPPGGYGQRDLGVPHLIPHGGYTDTSLFNREFWGYSRYWWFPEWNKFGHWIVFDDKHYYALSLYNKDNQGAEHKLYNWADADTPARLQGNLKDAPPPFDPLKEKSAFTREQPLWAAPVPLVPRGFAQAGDNLCVLGIPALGRSPDEVRDAALDKGPAKVLIVSAADGQPLGGCALPATCVFDGLSAAQGKLLAALVNGQLVCVGQ